MINIRNLWKRYGKTDVLKGMDLEVKRGEVLVILGRSGVGKSVLLRHIIGIEKPDNGVIEVEGVCISNLKHDALYKAVRNMGMLFQGSALFDSMNIGENTAFHLKQHGNPDTGEPYTDQELKEKVANALSMVGLEGTQKKMPSELSGGMRKRAGLARLIVYRPTILLYDEPTTGLDPMTAYQISDLIVQTQAELKGTSIVVTHDIASALHIADRIALHQDGKIAYIDKPEAFIQIDDPTIQFIHQTMTLSPRKS